MTREQAYKVANLISRLAEMYASREAEKMDNRLSDWDGSPEISIGDIERVAKELEDALVEGKIT